MSGQRAHDSPNRGTDPDGVRIVATDARGRRDQKLYQGVALFLVAACAGYVLMPRKISQAGPDDRPRVPETEVAITRGATPADRVAAPSMPPPGEVVASETAGATGSIPRRLTARPAASKSKENTGIPDDQDPSQQQEFVGIPRNVTAKEYIQALHDAGVYEGIGAFNPPGTSPPLDGLEVPEDYELPEGYVRHYQTTDDGQPIKPILMYSPDYEFFDENGNRVDIPEDRVVPPDKAPPGMPIHPIEIPKPKEPGTGDLGR